MVDKHPNLHEDIGQATLLGYNAEEKPAVFRECCLRVRLGSLGGGEPKVRRGLRMAAEEVFQILVVRNLHQVPVVQAAALHVPPDGALGDVEAQGADH